MIHTPDYFLYTEYTSNNANLALQLKFSSKLTQVGPLVIFLERLPTFKVTIYLHGLEI
jgi:hypothetical protein